MHKVITSVQNPRVKQWADLLTKKGRDQQGKYILEGTHLVVEALSSDCDVECVVYDAEHPLPDELVPYQSTECEWIQVHKNVLHKCTSTHTPQRVFAVVAKREHLEDQLWSDQQPLVVVLDEVQDPGNVGTIIRSAEASGATAIIVGRGSADIYNPKTIRAAMGSVLRMPIYEGDLLTYIQKAHERGIRMISTGLADDSRHCYEIDWTAPHWFVIGNEGAGVSAAIQAEVDEVVTIPMVGRTESLNAAMAATVLLFEAMRQRNFQ